MKKIALLFVFLFTLQFTTSQNFAELGSYEFTTIESYKTEQDKVLQCANYLFTTPANVNELNRLISLQYIMKWMTGTPDYTFEIDTKAMELTKGNDDLLGLYFAAMTKIVLENKGDKLSNEELYNKAENMLVNYCANPDFKMKPSRKIKKIIKSRK